MMMSDKKNHYELLGIPSDVGAAEIKRAYRVLAKSMHPDAKGHEADSPEHTAATEEMMRVNEAYATLIDAKKRAEYDVKIGVRVAINIQKPIFTSVDEDHEREKFLRSVFYPTRTNIGKLLSAYKGELRQLSLDPYDDRLMEEFQAYVDKIEDGLRKGSDSLSRNQTPRSLEAAVLTMRQAIAQASDGLDELRYFCSNYDYNHLRMAENLFRISNDLSRQSLALTKGC